MIFGREMECENKNEFLPPGKYKSKNVNNKLDRVFYDLSYDTNINVPALLNRPKHRFEVGFLFLPDGYTKKTIIKNLNNKNYRELNYRQNDYKIISESSQ